MNKKIRNSIILVSIITLLCSTLLIIGTLYNYFTTSSISKQKDDLNLVAESVSNMGIDYLNSISTNQYRITWINYDGTVLYDSIADISTMENHSDREEFIEANTLMYGHSKRTSKTLSQDTFYSAKKLNDNTIIRISFNQLSILSIIYNMLFIIIIIIIISILLSILLANNISNNIIKPLNNLDLNNPLDNDIYDELSFLLTKIDKQNNKINKQLNILEERNKEISLITENVLDGIIILNSKGNILSCNKVAKELLSCNINDYYLSYYRDLDYKLLIEDALNGKRGKAKLKINNDIYAFIASPTLLNNNNFSIFIFIRNITEEEKLLELRRQFSANVSHELKTPLTSIMGASELLKNNLVKDKDINVFANNIYNEAKRLLNLVHNIIKISRLDEQNNLEYSNININALTSDIINQLKDKINNKNITINYNNNNNIIINAIPTILHEILYNLCDNAINYNIDNGLIDINISKDTNNIIWTIKDTGIGIQQNELDRIFERFYRVDKSHSKETGGSGLGLSIVKNGMNLHNGLIDISSDINKGTKISLIFKI